MCEFFVCIGEKKRSYGMQWKKFVLFPCKTASWCAHLSVPDKYPRRRFALFTPLKCFLSIQIFFSV